ncbi:tail assembly protein [Psychrobacter aquimaris]|uniref:tail assembly protein n=1 Tax=Psychrobacter aquimaris TaxID=292733 RepID=UPI0018DEFB49|nr:tail assembly protein [Psychrobacter aquimaris]
MLRKIELHGVLGEKFGKSFVLDVESPREAAHAIACQIREFKIFMLRAEQEGMRFAIFLDEVNEKANIGEKELDNTTSASVIHIVPKIMGAGGDTMGWIQVIAGAVLIGFSGGNPAMIAAGAGMMLGGAASLLMPSPSIGERDEEGNRANHGFGGAVTTVAQGNPVPILYGERMIGGAICSAGIYTEDNQ